MSQQATKIERRYADPVINLALDTIEREKQALIFVNAKRSAEKVATDILLKIKATPKEEVLKRLAESILKAPSQPTEQCQRLAKAVEKGIAFHHAGLDPKQKEIIEDAFRGGTIPIIACTPTLAAGLDLPAFRTIIRDLKRYTGSWGMQHIPVLEYHQMAGRAGRPGKEEYGEAICLAANTPEKEMIIQTFLKGDAEPIYSKLAVEPVLRTYVLSLVASGFIASIEDAITFFKKTFWAKQFGDMHKLQTILERVIELLRSYMFLVSGEEAKTKQSAGAFQSGSKLISGQKSPLRATPLGERVAQLYIDPLTAHGIIEALKRAKEPTTFAYLHVLCNTLEMRPHMTVRTREVEAIEDELVRYKDDLIQEEPDMFDYGYQDFLNAFKTALAFRDWLDEAGEDVLYERYGLRPGELRAKLSILDWLCYCSYELTRLIDQKQHTTPLYKIRTRLSYGVKEELLPLLRFKGIGRVRARLLYNHQIRHSGDIRKASLEQLAGIIGKKTAEKLKKDADSITADFAPLEQTS
jgi:helicase